MASDHLLTCGDKSLSSQLLDQDCVSHVHQREHPIDIFLLSKAGAVIRSWSLIFRMQRTSEAAFIVGM